MTDLICSTAACAHLREREQRRQQHAARMAAYAAVHVVVIECMTGITGKQRGMLRRRRNRAADHRCCAGRIWTAHRQQFAVTVVASAGECGGNEIEQAAPCGIKWEDMSAVGKSRIAATGGATGNLPVPARMGALDTSEASVRAQPIIRAFYIAYSTLLERR